MQLWAHFQWCVLRLGKFNDRVLMQQDIYKLTDHVMMRLAFVEQTHVLL